MESLVMHLDGVHLDPPPSVQEPWTGTGNDGEAQGRGTLRRRRGFRPRADDDVPEASEHHRLRTSGTTGLAFTSRWPTNGAATKPQHAFEVYRRRFTPTETEDGWINEETGERSVCVDVNELASPEMNDESVQRHIPEHELLVGGFPCQDYSVARTLRGEGGIRGKKGVLWWNIHKIVEARKPRMVLLENVDRLLKSPSTARGRDFAIMLRTFEDLGYVTEWRVINAADYGMPQRRRRVFILARRVEEVGALFTESARRTHLSKPAPLLRHFPVADAVVHPPSNPRCSKPLLAILRWKRPRTSPNISNGIESRFRGVRAAANPART